MNKTVCLRQIPLFQIYDNFTVLFNFNSLNECGEKVNNCHGMCIKLRSPELGIPVGSGSENTKKKQKAALYYVFNLQLRSFCM